MKASLPRRGFLQGSSAALVLAFYPGSKAWASGPPCAGGIHVPHLDGELLADAATLAQAADDFGHIVHQTPTAVLVPGSVDDIVKMVKFARAHGIKITPTRSVGGSHSTQGQAQLDGGVIIDMSALAEIHSIGQHSAYVDAGVTWIDLLSESVPQGKSPPTLNDYIGLSVGGTLAVGGIGGQAFRAGFQVDNVIELEVVTGKGQRVTCSPTKNPLVYHAVRAGLGQFGIIVRAKLRLESVPPSVRVYTASYDDLATFTSDQLALIDDGRFDYVEGSASFGVNGWGFTLEAAKYFSPSCPPNDAALLAGLHYLPGTSATADSTYFDFANRLAPTIAFLTSIGVWQLPHPWFNVFIPKEETVDYVQSALDQMTPADTGGGPVLLYPFNNCHGTTAPFLRLPSSDQVFIFSVLRTAIPPTPEVIDAMITQNRAFFDALTAIGGKRYPIDSVPMSHADWQAHFGPLWGLFAYLKSELDPDNVLTPGQAIF